MSVNQPVLLYKRSDGNYRLLISTEALDMPGIKLHDEFSCVSILHEVISSVWGVTSNDYEGYRCRFFERDTDTQAQEFARYVKGLLVCLRTMEISTPSITSGLLNF